MASLWVSFANGLTVAFLSTLVGTTTAFLFERRDFPGKAALYVLMVLPLVVPGIILGISILVFASSAARFTEEWTGLGAGWLRPGTPLVVAARLRKFDVGLNEAALNLGIGRARVLATVTLPFLKPALLSSFLLAFLVSFQDFNTTLMLFGSQSPLTVTMYNRMAKAGSTPVLNAMSVLLTAGSGLLALLSILAQRTRAPSGRMRAGRCIRCRTSISRPAASSACRSSKT